MSDQDNSPLGNMAGSPFQQQIDTDLRDWFAGQALAGMFHAMPKNTEIVIEDLCLKSYEIADAMMAARKAKS